MFTKVFTLCAMSPPPSPLPSWDFLFRFQCILIANSFNVRPCGVHILSYFPVSPRELECFFLFLTWVFRRPSRVYLLFRVCRCILGIWHKRIQQHWNWRQYFHPKTFSTEFQSLPANKSRNDRSGILRQILNRFDRKIARQFFFC